MDDLISRQAAIDILDAYQVMVENGEENPYTWARLRMSELPSAQPEITDEQAIEHLQSTGWMQNHDREIYESGLREQLADDSGSYDSLIPCEDTISRQAAIDALNEYFARIGKLKRRGLNRGEKAISLDTVGTIENLPPVEAIPVSWIEAKIELVNDLPGVSMLKMKAADWVDLVKQWRAEQRNPEVDHDAQIRELAEEMQKHGVHKPTADPSTAQTTETTADTTAPTTDGWIPVERELPEDLAEVNVTWVNHEPEPYYESIKSKPFTASAVYYEGNWYWYSSVCADVLAEYGRNDVDKVDDTIEITAWRPLPEPYRGGDE